MRRRNVADLHVHTTASDGILTPEEVVQEAYNAGLAGIGITDHDTVDGVPPALAAGQESGIVVVPGVEINTDINSSEVHMLGYFIDPESESLLAELENLRVQRLERARKMVQRLNELGMDISFDRVKEIAGDGSIGRPHIARAMVEGGYTQSVNSAFGKYLVHGAPGFVPRYKLTPLEAIDIIRRAGGVAVMAHPGDSKEDALIPSLVEAGMRGLEVYHTDHSKYKVRHYREIARRFGLVATGGSDSHGPTMMKMIAIGHVTCDMDAVEKLRELAG